MKTSHFARLNLLILLKDYKLGEFNLQSLQEKIKVKSFNSNIYEVGRLGEVEGRGGGEGGESTTPVHRLKRKRTRS